MKWNNLTIKTSVLSLLCMLACNFNNSEQKTIATKQEEKSSPALSQIQKFPYQILLKDIHGKKIGVFDFLNQYAVSINYADSISLEYQKINKWGAKKYFSKFHNLEYNLIFFQDGLQMKSKIENLSPKILWTAKYHPEDLGGKGDAVRKKIFSNAAIKLYQGESVNALAENGLYYKLQKTKVLYHTKFITN